MAYVSDSARLAALEEIVKRRTKTLDYLQRVYSGQARFLNVVQITEKDVDATFPSDRSPDIAKRYTRFSLVLLNSIIRVERWFTLGISLGGLIQSANGAAFVRALAQLLEEFDYYYGHAASKGIVRFLFDYRGSHSR